MEYINKEILNQFSSLRESFSDQPIRRLIPPEEANEYFTKQKEKRRYFAISIKHSEYNWKFGEPCVLWGCNRTKDNEPRCFAGYTKDIHSAELYSINEFINKYGEEICNPHPVKMVRNLMEAHKKYDTVLMDKDDYETYYNMCIEG